jgi:WD40 repeat protein
MRYFAILFWVFVWDAACADERPILQLDTGGHMAAVRGVAFTPDGNQLVSAGEDKVIRVWDLTSGKTVRTIRGEIALGIPGKIYAMALSLDGKWLAAGGDLATFDGTEVQGGKAPQTIRLYDFKSGKLVALLKGHTNVIRSLAFSPDGSKLISGSSDHTAIIWDTGVRSGVRLSAPKLLHRLEGHKADIFTAVFSPDGRRAVTGSYDKDLRLWQVSNGTQIARMAGHTDKVYRVAIARDGTIASGDISGAILLWDGRNGRLLRTLVRNKNGVGSLNFSVDGKLMLATCGFGNCSGALGYVYNVASGQVAVTYSGHDNAVQASAFSPDGRWVATGGGANNEIHIWDPLTGQGRLGADGKPLRLAGHGQLVWSAGFSADGRRIGWGNQDACPEKPQCPNEQIILKHALTLPLGDAALAAPEALTGSDANNFRHASPSFEGWSLAHRAGGHFGSGNAILDISKGGQVVASITREVIDGFGHHTYSFSPGGETIISGGSYGVITAYDREGKTLGAFSGHESKVFAAVPSPDGRYLVSGSADETVRLWNLKTRELLVSLYQGTDGEWVIWTPEGFFAASEKGAERVGWHINQGPAKEARYVASARLRKFFFRPDLVTEKIKGDPDHKVRDAADKINIKVLLKAALAPEVEILSPAQRASLTEAKVTVVARIRDTGGGIGAISFKVNGQAVARVYGALMLDLDGRISHDLDLAAEESTLEVMASTPEGIESFPASVSVKSDPRAIKKDPRLFVLAIGADSYRDTKKKLNYAKSDAETLANAFRSAGAGFYRGEPVVKTLFDEDVTAGKVEAAFGEMAGMVQATDVFVFYMAGHGKTLNGDFHFVPPAISGFTDDAIKQESFGPDKLSAWFAKIKAFKSIWVFDACESGSAERLLKRDAASDDAALQRLRSETGRPIFMAADEEQAALEGFHKHGLLTYALIEGIARAGNGDHIQLYDLAEYVRTEVPKLSRELEGCKVTRPEDYCQKPVVGLGSAENYPVLPRSAKVLALIDAEGPFIGKKPTHVVMVSAELLESAARGGQVKRQLNPGDLVTLIETADGWAKVAQNGQAIGFVQQSALLRMNN